MQRNGGVPESTRKRQVELARGRAEEMRAVLPVCLYPGGWGALADATRDCPGQEPGSRY